MKKIKNKTTISILVIVAILTMSFTSNFFEIAKQIDIYTSLFKEVNKHYVDPINPAKLTEKALSNMLKELDPYTLFYDEQRVEDARISSTGEYGGIGTRISYKNKKMIVREIFDDSPSRKAGLKVGDEILKINDAVVKDFEGSDVLTLLKGLPGTKVKLHIKRQQKELKIEVPREKIIRQAVPFYTLTDENIGYIALSKFTDTASKEVKAAYEQLKQQGMQKLIIDLQGNPGGLLREAINMVNLFIPKDKIVVTTKGKIQEHTKTYKTTSNPIDLKIPIVVLINDRSASASEIVSGALQDYDRAVVIGKRSFGKGLVQRYYKLPYGTQVKVTVSRYYIPSGRCIQKLDYSNRSKDGKVPKFSDAKKDVFSTEKGRKVYGGGGVLPDIVLKQPKLSETSKKLLQSDIPFMYAVNYSYKNANIGKSDAFQLNDSDFVNFQNFANQHQKEFTTETENHLIKAKKESEKEGLKSHIASSYKILLKDIHQQKIRDLSSDKQQILQQITNEILKCYYSEEEIFEHKMVFDKAIQKAIEIVKDSDKYQKIIQ